MSDLKTYTAKDIERYLKGEMPAAEMHLLEKAALDDPMLADALEGYAYTTTASADIDALQTRLQQRLQKDKKTTLVSFGSQWLKIAALLLLLAGGGWLVFQPFSNKGDKLARTTATEPLKEQKNNPPFATTDSTSSLVHLTAPLPATDSQRYKNLVAIETKPARTANAVTDKVASENDAIKDNTTASNETGSAGKTMRLLREEKQADSASHIVAFNDKAAAPAGTYRNDTIKNVNIVLKPTNEPLNEVVIAKKRQLPMARKMDVVIDTLEPEQGWTSFDDYVAENIKEPQELRAKPVSTGEVELSFDIDKEGNPVNIVVTRSLCDKCDAEAIRLLKEGPKWKGKKNKGKVKIKF